MSWPTDMLSAASGAGLFLTCAAAAFLKLKHSSNILDWARRVASPPLDIITLAALVCGDLVICLSIALLWDRPQLPILSMGVVVAFAMLRTGIHKMGLGGCPCFGAASSTLDIYASAILAGVYALGLASAITNSVAHPSLSASLIASCGIGGLVFVAVSTFNLAASKRTKFTGRLNNAKRVLLDRRLPCSDASRSGGGLVICLGSLSCSGCMRIAERFASLEDNLLATHGHFVDMGVAAPSETVLGKARLVSIGGELSKALKVRYRPALVFIRGDRFETHLGVGACASALDAAAPAPNCPNH